MEAFVDLKMRFLILSIASVIVGLIIGFAQNIVVQFVITCLIATLGAIAIWEYVKILKIKGICLPFWLLGIISVVYIFANYLSTVNGTFQITVSGVVGVFFFAIFFYNFYKIDGAIINIATSFFGTLYIIVPLGLLIKILYPNTMNPLLHDGRLWVVYLISVTKVTDMGGYFVGKLWGKMRLAPHISPSKTVLGGIAGFFSAICLSLIFYLISMWFELIAFRLSFIEAVILGGLLGLFSQLGDLAESLLKRDAKIKDSNRIPGIGGVLDSLDSLLFTIPILYLFLKASGSWL